MLDNNQLISSLSQLISENQNSETLDIDQLSSLELVTKINQQDHLVSQAISKILPQIAKVVDLVVAAFKQGGRLIYLGAGTSGRLGVLDAVECVPTFGVEPSMVVAVMAGGEAAMFRAKEGVEDSAEAAVYDLAQVKLNSKDVLVGISASGRTPYVIGGLGYAAQQQAKTVALSCNPNAEISQHADLALLPVVGAEVLTGSTRMKSGTAQKLVLNILSTASMIRSGKTYGNLMVDLKATNQKLYARGTHMLMQVTGVDQMAAEAALERSGMQVKLAILMILSGLDANAAQSQLDKADGFLRKALQMDKASHQSS